MGESLKPLLDLQEVDHARDRLAERKEKLPAKTELADLEQRIAEVQAAEAASDREIDAVVRDVDAREAELRKIEDKIAEEEKKLYSGAVVNPKELSALQSEIEMLKRRKAPMEEAILERLVERDEHFAERNRLRAELADIEKEADAVRTRIADEVGVIDGELGVEDAKRAEILPLLPQDVIEQYEELRSQKHGTGVGALVEGACTACREALPAMVVDKIKQRVRAGESRFRCEHCRRILVVT